MKIVSELRKKVCAGLTLKDFKALNLRNTKPKRTMKTVVYYNGFPIKLSKGYAKGELKRSEKFVSQLQKNIDAGLVKDVSIQGALDLLNRRKSWCNALREYLQGNPLPQTEF